MERAVRRDSEARLAALAADLGVPAVMQGGLATREAGRHMCMGKCSSRCALDKTEAAAAMEETVVRPEAAAARPAGSAVVDMREEETEVAVAMRATGVAVNGIP